MNSFHRARLPRLFSFLGSAVALAAFAQSEPAPASRGEPVLALDRLVVSATRSPQDPKFVPSVVTVLKPQDLELAQISSLADALSGVPGISVAQTGAVGGPTSVFMRGGNSDHTLFFVDGIRMNTADAAYPNFLGAADLAGLNQIEVLRGPQSTLYGSSALGGVIVLNTATASSTPIEKASFEAGSFKTYRGVATGSASSGRLGGTISLSALSTDNDRDFNQFDQVSYSGRAEFRVTPNVVAGFTLRGQDASSESPGSVGSTFVGSVDSLTHLSTVYGEWKASERASSRVTLGWFQQEYTYTPEPPPRGNAYDTPYYSRDTRGVLDWQNNWNPTDALALVAGLNVENERVTSVTDTVDRYDNDARAGYALATWRPEAHTTLMAGVRYDDFENFGDATTWKLGASYLLAGGAKLHASYGTGFAAPRPVYVVGGPFYNPNPGIKPEESQGWDAGIDQALWSDKAHVGVTYFRNRFRELFIYDFTIPGIVNTGQASAEGVEFAFDVAPTSALRFDLSYTYTDARNDSAKRPLIRRPRNVLDAQVRWEVSPQVLVGAGLHAVASRFDGSTTAPVRVEDYTTVRVFAQYRLPDDLVLKVRVENALDEEYQDVRGYPALPAAVYGSVEWTF